MLMRQRVRVGVMLVHMYRVLRISIIINTYSSIKCMVHKSNVPISYSSNSFCWVAVALASVL